MSSPSLTLQPTAERDTAANLPVVMPTSGAGKTAYTVVFATKRAETMIAPAALWEYGTSVTGNFPKRSALTELLRAAGLIRTPRTRVRTSHRTDAEFAQWSRLLSGGRSLTDLIREDRDA